MRTTATRLATLLALSLPACGGDGGGDADTKTGSDADALPSAALTVQERIELADFEAEAAADPALGAVAAGMTLTVAGRVEDDEGRVVHWAEASDGRAAVRHCDGDDCVSAVQTRTASGLSWEAADGSDLEVRPVGRPALRKVLDGHELANKTTLAAGLALDKAALPDIDFETRRFVALNTFGDAFGTRLAAVTGAATRHGGFHEVTEVQYAREVDVHEAFATLDLMDAVVWLTQGVGEVTSTQGPTYRTVGLTVNRGGFGDATYVRDLLGAGSEWASNVAGGPGVLFLAASHSYSDGSEGQPDGGSVWAKVSGPGRLVVGVEGGADVTKLLAATEAFFDAWLGGEATLAEAVAAGDAALAGTGARLRTNQENKPDETWPLSYERVWAGKPFTPKQARFIIPITAVPYCGSPKKPGTEDFGQSWADVTFDGAYFEGTNVTSSMNVTLRGVVTGFEVGDRVYFETWGNLDKIQFQDFHAFGEGLVREVTTLPDGKFEVRFNGPAHTAPYKNDKGEECTLNNPQISTTTSKMATLTLTP